MANLPPELKQRVCSFLSPRELKPLRLVCKSFAAAAERYFITRFVLFNHPDSLEKLCKVANHKVFGKFLNTIIYDSMLLQGCPEFEDWQRVQKTHPQYHFPTWDEYRPQSITLNDHESYAVSTTTAMLEASDRFQAACRVMKQTNKNDWQKHQKLVKYQRSEEACKERTEVVLQASKKCAALKNIVVSPLHLRQIRNSRSKIFNIHGSDELWDHVESSYTRFDLWELMPTLNSLSLLEVELLNYPGSAAGRSFDNLRHLRVCSTEDYWDEELDNLREIFSGAKSLETLTLSISETGGTEILQAVRSDRLRVCLLEFRCVTETALVEFLLYHANTLERLGLYDISLLSGTWSGVFDRISCQFPNLKQVQIEVIRLAGDPYAPKNRNYGVMAEKFVMYGGMMPDENLVAPARASPTTGEGCLGKDYIVERLPRGLWHDYESFANDSWMADVEDYGHMSSFGE